MGFYSDADFLPDSSIGYLCKRVHQLAQAGLEPVFAAENMTFVQWHALLSIYFERATTSAALARDLAYDKGATTRLIDQLEARGWVTRSREHDDRRLVALRLTDEGEALARRRVESLVAPIGVEAARDQPLRAALLAQVLHHRSGDVGHRSGPSNVVGRSGVRA